MTVQKNDAKLDYVPNSFMNWVLTTVLYEFMKNTQAFPAKFDEKDNKN